MGAGGGGGAGRVNLREQDPAEVLRSYGEAAAADANGIAGALRRAYADTQPQRLLSGKTFEQEEAEAKSAVADELRMNLAGGGL